jgi:hypothetical protein
VFVTVELLTFGGIVLPCFFIFLVSALGFVYQRPSHWLDVLITFSFSGEIVSVFKQDSEVAMLKCYFSPLDWGYGSEDKHSPTHGTGPDPQHCSDKGKLANVCCRRVSCPLLGCFLYKGSPFLCTGEPLLPAEKFMAFGLGRFLLTPQVHSLCSQGQQASKPVVTPEYIKE